MEGEAEGSGGDWWGRWMFGGVLETWSSLSALE